MSERITINLTEPKEEIKFTLTDQSEEVVFSFSEAARGPQGEPGSAATVDQTIIDGSANAVSGNAVFDGLALKAPIANPTFTGIVTAPRITGRCDGLEVFCKAGLAISAGQVVYVTGASGNNIIIGLAQANAELTSSKTIGISESTLANNATGYVITEGLMTVSISAPTAVEGDPIWLSPTTAGGMVFGAANKPVAPNHMVYLGVVTRKTGNTVVEIFVKVQNGSELEELADVLITSPTAGQTLMRGASLWENRSLVSADISDATSAATPNTIVKRDSQGRALFAATGFGAAAVNGTSPDGVGISGVSTNSAALNGTSTNGFGVSSFSTSGTGLSAGSSSGLGGRTRTVSGTNHHEFGTITGDDRSFVRRVLGLFGWNRGSFVQTLGSPATLTADSAISLPDIASGTLALTTDEMTPTAAGIAAKINGASEKTTPVDADEIPIADSAASFGLKKVTWLNVWNYIVTKIGAITSITAGGAWSFSSTTRPTSSGTGTPTATSLITATDRRTEEVSDLTNLYYRQIMGHELGVWATVGISPSSVIDGNSRTGCRFIGTTGLSSASAQGGGIKYPDGGITGGSTFDLRTSFDLRFLFRNSLTSTIFDIAHFVSLRNNTNFWSASSIGLYHVAQPADTWAATTAYTVGNRINVSGIVYVCSTAGTSGLTQPTFNATINGTTNDLTAVWRTLGPHTSDKWALAFVDASINITLTDTGVAWVAGTTNTTALRLRSNGSSVFASVNGSAEVSVSRGVLFAATPYIMCRGESATNSRIAGLIWTTESLI